MEKTAKGRPKSLTTREESGVLKLLSTKTYSNILQMTRSNFARKKSAAEKKGSRNF